MKLQRRHGLTRKMCIIMSMQLSPLVPCNGSRAGNVALMHGTAQECQPHRLQHMNVMTASVIQIVAHTRSLMAARFIVMQTADLP